MTFPFLTSARITFSKIIADVFPPWHCVYTHLHAADLQTGQKPLLSQAGPSLFQWDTAKPHSALITTAWLSRRKCLTGSDMSPTGNTWHIITEKLNSGSPELLWSWNALTSTRENKALKAPQLRNWLLRWTNKFQVLCRGFPLQYSPPCLHLIQSAATRRKQQACREQML